MSLPGLQSTLRREARLVPGVAPTLITGDMVELFADRLKRLREARKLMQRELAALAGMDPARVSKYESGALQEPRGATLARLARALNVSVADLRGNDAPRGRADLAELEPLLRQVRRAWGRSTTSKQREIEQALRRITDKA